MTSIEEPKHTGLPELNSSLPLASKDQVIDQKAQSDTKVQLSLEVMEPAIEQNTNNAKDDSGFFKTKEDLEKSRIKYYEEHPEELAKKRVSKEQSQTKNDTVTRTLESTVDPYVSDKFKFWRLILISALVFIGLGVIIYIFRRPRK